MEPKMRENMEAHFLSPLLVEQMTEVDWCLTAPFRYYSAVLKKTIIVPVQFVTDFASVPRWPVIFMLAGGEAVRPAVIHDYLYRVRPHECERAQADAVFEEAMGLTGQPWWRRKLMWLGVRAFGGTPYNAGTNPPGSGRSNAAAYNLRRPPQPKASALRAAKSPTSRETK